MAHTNLFMNNSKPWFTSNDVFTHAIDLKGMIKEQSKNLICMVMLIMSRILIEDVSKSNGVEMMFVKRV